MGNIEVNDLIRTPASQRKHEFPDTETTTSAARTVSAIENSREPHGEHLPAEAISTSVEEKSGAFEPPTSMSKSVYLEPDLSSATPDIASSSKKEPKESTKTIPQVDEKKKQEKIKKLSSLWDDDGKDDIFVSPKNRIRNANPNPVATADAATPSAPRPKVKVPDFLLGDDNDSSLF